MHAALALRQAAGAWPPLERLLEVRVPDEITLGSDEVTGLLSDGLGALKAIGVDVHWPRDLGRELTSAAVLDRAPARAGQEQPLQSSTLGADSLFAFRWQVSLHGDPLSDEEMARLAESAGSVVRLRDSWVVVDPATAEKARRRLIRTVRPSQALAAALTGRVPVGPEHAAADGAEPGEGEATGGLGSEAEVVVGASLLHVRDRLRQATTREPVPIPAGLDATLRHYQHQGLTWLAELTSLGLGACLADDMGLGKTITLIALHLHRAETRAETVPGMEPGPDPPGDLRRRGPPARRAPPWWSAPPRCSATGRRRSAGSPPACRSAASTAATAPWRRCTTGSSSPPTARCATTW